MRFFAFCFLGLAAAYPFTVCSPPDLLGVTNVDLSPATPKKNVLLTVSITGNTDQTMVEGSDVHLLCTGPFGIKVIDKHYNFCSLGPSCPQKGAFKAAVELTPGASGTAKCTVKTTNDGKAISCIQLDVTVGTAEPVEVLENRYNEIAAF